MRFPLAHFHSTRQTSSLRYTRHAVGDAVTPLSRSRWFAASNSSSSLMSASVAKHFLHTQNNTTNIVAQAQADKLTGELEVAKMMAEAQTEKLKAETDAIKLNSQAEADATKLNSQAEADATKLNSQAEADATKLKSQAETEKLKAEADATKLKSQAETEKLKAEADDTKLKSEAFKSKSNRNRFVSLVAGLGILLIFGDHIYCENPTLNAYRILKRLESRPELLPHGQVTQVGGAPFVNRSDELLARDPVRTINRVLPVAVLGPVGYGKTALLERFAATQPFSLFASLRTNENNEYIDSKEDLIAKFSDLAAQIGIPARRSYLSQLLPISIYDFKIQGEQIVASSWARIFNALRDGIRLFHQRHPDKYATIIVDEVTFLLPREHDQDYIIKFKEFVLNKLITMAVQFGADENIACFYISSSSPYLAHNVTFKLNLARFDDHMVSPMSVEDRVNCFLLDPQYKMFKSYPDIVERVVNAVGSNRFAGLVLAKVKNSQPLNAVLLNTQVESKNVMADQHPIAANALQLNTHVDSVLASFEDKVFAFIFECKLKYPVGFEELFKWTNTLDSANILNDQGFVLPALSDSMKKILCALHMRGYLSYQPLTHRVHFVFPATPKLLVKAARH